MVRSMTCMIVGAVESILPGPIVQWVKPTQKTLDLACPFVFAPMKQAVRKAKA